MASLYVWNEIYILRRPVNSSSGPSDPTQAVQLLCYLSASIRDFVVLLPVSETRFPLLLACPNSLYITDKSINAFEAIFITSKTVSGLPPLPHFLALGFLQS